MEDELFEADDLNGVPREQRSALLDALKPLLGLRPLIVQTFRDLPWFVVPLGEGEYTYSTNQTNEAERYAGALNEVAFPAIHALGKSVLSDSASVGFMVQVVAKSKAMAGQYSWLNGTDRETLDVYVPASLARQFARAEITSQELVDGSFILRGEIRIKVDLTR